MLEVSTGFGFHVSRSALSLSIAASKFTQVFTGLVPSGDQQGRNQH